MDTLAMIAAYPFWAKATMLSCAVVFVLVAVFAAPAYSAPTSLSAEPIVQEPEEHSMPKSQKNSETNITSNSQSGGITAHTVNIGSLGHTDSGRSNLAPRITPHTEDEWRALVVGKSKSEIADSIGKADKIDMLGKWWYYAAVINQFAEKRNQLVISFSSKANDAKATSIQVL